MTLVHARALLIVLRKSRSLPQIRFVENIIVWRTMRFSAYLSIRVDEALDE